MTVHFNTEIPRNRIDTLLAIAPAHMRPILHAVRDFGCAWATIPQRAGRFEVPKGLPLIAIIGDDLHVAMGPAGFHRKSVRRLIAASRVISIVAAEPKLIAYAAPAGIAAGPGLNGLIIETRPEFEMQWLGLVKAENPGASLIIVSVKERGH